MLYKQSMLLFIWLSGTKKNMDHYWSMGQGLGTPAREYIYTPMVPFLKIQLDLTYCVYLCTYVLCIYSEYNKSLISPAVDESAHYCSQGSKVRSKRSRWNWKVNVRRLIKDIRVNAMFKTLKVL